MVVIISQTVVKFVQGMVTHRQKPKLLNVFGSSCLRPTAYILSLKDNLFITHVVKSKMFYYMVNLW